MTSTSLSPARHHAALAARRARIRRTGQTFPPLDPHRWADIHRHWAPFPDPTVMWGMGDDGFPLILELSDPAAGAMVVMAEAGRENLMTAVLLSLAWLNAPETAAAHVVTSRPDAWQWAQRIPHLNGISSPADGGLQTALRRAYQHNRYLLVLADGDDAARSLPAKLLAEGPANGLWPLVFCSPQVGLSITADLPAWAWTPIQGYMRRPAAGIAPSWLLLPAASLRPGQAWATAIRKRIVRFRVPTQ